MENPQDRSLKEIGVNNVVYDFIADNNSDYDFIGRSIEYRAHDEHVGSNYVDILLVDFDSPSFRITDFTYGTQEWAEMKNQMVPSQQFLSERVEELCIGTAWSGQIKSVQPGESSTDYRPHLEGDVYSEVEIGEKEAVLLDELSAEVLGYSLQEWESKYEWIDDIS